MLHLVPIVAADPITNGLTTLSDDAKGWLVLIAVLAGVSAYGLHAVGYRHASDMLRTAFVGLAGAAVLAFGAPWLVGLFHV